MKMISVWKAALIGVVLAPAAALAGEGTEAVAGLERVASEMCRHPRPSTDPLALASALEGDLGTAMGLRNADTIIGTISLGDPRAGAQMWASTLSRRPGGCKTLIRILVQPVDVTLAEVRK